MSHTDDTLFQDICTSPFASCSLISTTDSQGRKWTPAFPSKPAVPRPPDGIPMHDQPARGRWTHAGFPVSGPAGVFPCFDRDNSLAWIQSLAAFHLASGLGPGSAGGGPDRSSDHPIVHLPRGAGRPVRSSRVSRAPFPQKGPRKSTHGTQRNQAARRKPTVMSRRWEAKSPINRSANWPRSSSC